MSSPSDAMFSVGEKLELIARRFTRLESRNIIGDSCSLIARKELEDVFFGIVYPAFGWRLMAQVDESLSERAGKGCSIQ